MLKAVKLLVCSNPAFPLLVCFCMKDRNRAGANWSVWSTTTFLLERQYLIPEVLASAAVFACLRGQAYCPLLAILDTRDNPGQSVLKNRH
jgi:hypothetical protein